MSAFIDEKIAVLAAGNRIVDVGGGFGHLKGMARYEDVLSGKRITLDYDPHTKPDIVGDIMALPFADDSQEAFICMSVLEHVDNPRKAVEELYRTLRPGGKALLYVPFLIPYHAREGVYRDYFRFTRDAVASLFGRFTTLETEPSRRFFEAWLLLLPRIGRKLSRAGRILDRVFNSGDRQVGGYNIFVIK